MGVCEPLMPNVPAPKADQNDHSYVSSADLPLELPSDSTQKILHGGALTWRTLKTTKLSKLGGAWALARVWLLAHDNMVVMCLFGVVCSTWWHFYVAQDFEEMFAPLSFMWLSGALKKSSHT